MVNLSQNPSARASLSYHDFPMHQHVEFTSPVAQLLPVYYDVLDPGDKIRAGQYMKTRTQPLSSAAMAKITEHLEWFFVPMHQIYKPFGNFFYGVQDFGSSLYNPDNGNGYYQMAGRFPYFSSKKLYNDIVSYKSGIAGLRTLKGESAYPQTIRLMDHLGLNGARFLDDLYDSGVVEGGNRFSFTPLLACAYQKIFMDHYRNGDRIANDPSCYNLDRFFKQDFEGDICEYLNNVASGTSEVPSHVFVSSFYQMRYRPVARDFYTNNFPSPIFGGGSVSAQKFGDIEGSDTTLKEVSQWLTQLRGAEIVDGEGNMSLGNTDALTASFGSREGAEDVRGYNLNQANIRSLFAADKLLEITRRAGKHYDAQTLAHFGVKVPWMIEGSCIRLAHHEQDLVIGDVVATAGTDTTPLGEIGGKGYSAKSSDYFDFVAPCHGVLMCIYSAEPLLDYYQEGADKLNCLIDKSDFYNPEYDNLGMQPMFGYQAFQDIGVQGLDPAPETWNTSILGWQYRFMELKCKMNRIFGGMKYTQKHWTVARNSRVAASIGAEGYYHDPAALDSIMEYAYNKGFKPSSVNFVDASSDLYSSDPLIHEIFFDVKKASKKSPYGLMPL